MTNIPPSPFQAVAQVARRAKRTSAQIAQDKANARAARLTTAAPWLDIGADVSHLESPTVSDILEVAGLDWRVNTVPMFVKQTDGEGKEHFVEVKQFRALERDLDDSLFDVVGTSFKVIQNDISMSAFMAAAKAGEMPLHTAGSLKGGHYVWAMAATKQARELPGGDRLRGELVMIQPHKHGAAFQAKFVVVREANNSTFTFTLSNRYSSAMWRMSHASRFNDAKQADMQAVLGITNRYMDEFVEKATALSNTNWSEREALRYLALVIQPDLVNEDQVPTTLSEAMSSDYTNRRFRQVAELLDETPGNRETGAYGTAWGAFNTITYALDHILGRNPDNRMAGAWIGAASREKARALDLAVEIAKGVPEA